MAASSLTSSFLSFLSPSNPPPLPKSLPLSHLSVSSSSSSAPPLVAHREAPLSAVTNPALSQANVLFFRSAYNVQVLVDDNEPEERLLGRFRREVMRAGVIQECKRRRFHENKQDEKKRRTRDAAKRNKRRRPPQRFTGPYKPEGPTVNKREDDGDNWDLPVGDIPY